MEYDKLLFALIAIILLAGLGLATTYWYSDYDFEDDFEDNIINQTFWHNYTVIDGSGTKIVNSLEQNGQMFLSSYQTGGNAYVHSVSNVRTNIQNVSMRYDFELNDTLTTGGANGYAAFQIDIVNGSYSKTAPLVYHDYNGDTIYYEEIFNSVRNSALLETGPANYTVIIDRPNLNATLYNSTNDVISSTLLNQFGNKFFAFATRASGDNAAYAETRINNFISRQWGVILISPEDDEYFISSDVTLNASVGIFNDTLTNMTFYIWNSTNGVINKTTIPLTAYEFENTNLDVNDLTSDIYHWGAYACSLSSCEWNLQNNTFVTGFVINSVTYNTNVYDTSIENYQLNITYDTSQITFSSVTLIYDGEEYATTSQTVGPDVIFSTSIQVPFVDSPIDKVFNWSVFLSDTLISDTYYTSNYNQTVGPINWSACPGGSEAVNYTIYDEETGDPVIADFDATFYYTLNRSLGQKNYSYEGTGASSYTFCINPNVTYLVDADIAVGANGYIDRIYRHRFREYTNASTLEPIYLLNNTVSSNIIIEVVDEGYQALPNYLVKIYRFQENTGDYILVEEQVTDAFGNFLARLVENSVTYKFEFYNPSGVLVKSEDVVNIVCRATICVLSFVVREDINDLDMFKDIENHEYSLTFNNVSNTFVYAWTDNTGDPGVTHRLKVTRYAGNGTETVCDTSSSSLSGALNCPVGDAEHAYLAQAFRDTSDSDERQIAVLSTIVEPSAQYFGKEGLFWATISLMIIVATALFSPVAAIILFVLGFLLFMLAGIVYIPPLAIITLIAIGAFFAWAFKS